MKKVAIYYSVKFGRNDGCPLYYFESLKDLGYKVDHFEPEGDTSRFGKYDYHFWVDWGEDGLPTDKSWRIPKDGGKTIYVCSDAHLGPKYRYEKAREFDYVFFNQKRFVEESGVKSHFLPHAVYPKAYPHFDIIKKYDVAFIGHIQDEKHDRGFSRIDLLDRMYREFPNFYFGTRSPLKPGANMFEDAAKKFCMSKVVFNISIKDDVNMRVFETMATGSFLLTNYLPTFKDVFGDYEGKLFVTYKTLDEAVEKARYYIEHDEERERIAKAGQDEVLKQHTYAERIKTIMDVINSK